MLMDVTQEPREVAESDGTPGSGDEQGQRREALCRAARIPPQQGEHGP